MAGDWIKMRSDLGTHPKVVRMASALNADRLRVIGGLHAVWCLFDMHSEDGKLFGYTLSAIDDLIGWPYFAQAMAGIEWLEVGDDYLCAPRFDAHNGQSAKRRAQESDRKREVRKASASEADKKRTREEKRREDIEEAKASSRGAKKCPASFVLTDDLKTWASIECPSVNVTNETAKLRDHTFKTARSDWPGTWRNWMRKAQEDAHASPGKSGTGETPYQRTMRERMQSAVPDIAARAPGSKQFIDVESKNVTANLLG